MADEYCPRRWKNNIFTFIEDVKPCILSGGKYEVFKPNRWQRRVLEAVQRGKHTTVAVSAPRRHGKSVLAAIIVLHRFLTRPHMTIAVASCSLTQTIAIGFRTLAGIIRHTPFLSSVIGDNVKMGRIEYPALDNLIIGLTSSEASAYGVGYDLVWLSELGQAPDDRLFQVLASSIGDRPDGMMLVDSTVGPKSTALYRLYKLAENGTDPSIFFHHETWSEGDPLPSYLSEEWLESRRATMLPHEFSRFHGNAWIDGHQALFPKDKIDACLGAVPLLSELRRLYDSVYVGTGCDFALSFSKNADKSYMTTIVKCYHSDDPQPHFYILRQKEVPLDKDRQAEIGVIEDVVGYLDGLGVEVFQGDSFAQWCRSSQYLYPEIIHPSRPVQAAAFTDFANIVNDGRLTFSPALEVLQREMLDFEVDPSTSVPTFGGAFKKRTVGPSDDAVFSTCWAIYALRRYGIYSRCEVIKLP